MTLAKHSNDNELRGISKNPRLKTKVELYFAVISDIW